MKMLRFLFPDASATFHPLVNNASKTSNSLVLILGWAGSKPRHLTKVVKAYQKLGMPAVTFIMPQFIPLFVRDHLEAAASKLIAEKLNESHSGGKLIVHSYSNNRIWTYGSLMKAQAIPTPAALVLDASPSLWYQKKSISESVSLLSRVFTAVILQKDVYEHPVVSPILKIFLTIGIAINDLLLRFPGSSKVALDLEQMNIYLRDTMPVVPLWFVYSSGDKLISPTDIQTFSDSISKRGFLPEHKLFGDEVSHTGSLFVYPDEYLSHLQAFLRRNGILP